MAKDVKIYLDHAATTPLDERVLEAMLPYMKEEFGNPNSRHFYGIEARKAVENSRETIAKILKCNPEEIIFTSGGTEADNTAIFGFTSKLKDKGKHIITSKFEHHAVLHPFEVLESRGFKASYIPITKDGFVDIDNLFSSLSDETIFVSVMHVNNEIGTIQPIERIAKECNKHGIVFFSDTVQSVGKLPIKLNKLKADAISASAHKFYGPKGVGFLYVRNAEQGCFKETEHRIEPLLYGGNQEFGLRSGTENVPGIVGLATALEIANKEMKRNEKHERKLRDALLKGLLEIEETYVNGSLKDRIASNLNVRFTGIEASALVDRLSLRGIACSTASACHKDSEEPSHVLTSIGLNRYDANSSVRFSLGKDNTEEEIELAIQIIQEEVEKLRSVSPLWK